MKRWVNEQNQYRFLFSETMGIPVLKTEERNIPDIENRVEDIEFIMTGRLIDKIKDDEDLIEKLQAELTQIKDEKSGCEVCVKRSDKLLWEFELVPKSPKYKSDYCPNCGRKLKEGD